MSFRLIFWHQMAEWSLSRPKEQQRSRRLQHSRPNYWQRKVMSCQKSSQIIHLKLCVCFIQRSISMVLAIRLAFLIKEATLMKCGTATFQIRMQIFSQVFISLFRSLFQCVLILHMEFFLTIRQSLILIWERKRQSAIILQQTAAI